MKHRIFLITLLFLLVHSVHVIGQSNTIGQESLKQVDSLINNMFQSHRPGAAFAIVKNGETVYKNFKGLANLEYQSPITDSTIFHIASVSKQFTTFLALLLEEEGKFSFEDDIKTYLPELNHLPNKITIKDLTNHTHGLPNIHELAHLKGVLPQVEMTHEEIVQYLLNIKRVNFNTKDHYEYNNTGYILLAEIIERVGKKPFKDQLKEKIFLPLDMHHSVAINDKSTIVKNKAYSYKLINDTYKNFPLRLSAIGASGINTSIDDLIKWAKNYQNPIVGKRVFYNKMEQATYLNSGKKINYGLGLQFGTYKGLRIVFHGGGDVGFRSYLLHIPTHELSIMILANTNDFTALDAIYNTIDILQKDDIKEDPTKTIELSNNELKKFEGTYEFYPGNYWTIIAKEDTLYFQQFGTNDLNPLPQLDETTFEFPYIAYSKFVFYENRFDFHIADFTYECNKTTINQPTQNEIKLDEFTGIFKNEEFNIIYELETKNSKLIVKRAFDSIVLNPLTTKSFYSPNLGKLDIIYNANGIVKGFELSGHNFKNIVFEK